jgi:hypothetical protein
MNDWAAGTTYTPSTGLGSAFKWGLNGGPQGLSQTGANAFGAGLRGIGQGMMQGGQGAFQNPGMSFASGLNNGMQAMRKPQGQGAFGFASGEGMGQQMSPIFNLKGLFGG